MILTIQGTSDLFLDLEHEVTETAAAGLPLRGSQMDATIRDSDGSGKCDLFLSFSPSVSYRQHPSEVHARAAYEAKNFIGWARLALTYPPKLQKRRIFLLKRSCGRDLNCLKDPVNGISHPPAGRPSPQRNRRRLRSAH